MFETKIVPIDTSFIQICKSSPTLERILQIRLMGEEEFVDEIASGTLRKNRKLGLRYREQYLHERIAYEFGYLFDIIPTTRLMFNDVATEGDCKPLTELGWFAERYLRRVFFPEDVFMIKQMNITHKDNSISEGAGLLCKQTSAGWLPSGHILFCLITQVDLKTLQWLPAQNPF